MKADVIRAQVTVTKTVKVLALVISMLDDVWSASTREHIIRMLVAYYKVSL